MIKTLNILLKQDKERFVVPKGVQDVIPVKAIYDDGIFQVGRDKFTRSFKFTDINYAVASREDKEAMFLEYSELLNSLDSGATTKITINNRRLNRLDFEKTILMPLKGDALDEYREEYNKMLLERATGANAYTQEKYITISVNKKNVEEARSYFARVGADLIAHFSTPNWQRCFLAVVSRASVSLSSCSLLSAVCTIVRTANIILWSRVVRSSRNSFISLRCCSRS